MDFIKAVRDAKNNGITSVSINRNHVTDEIVNEVKQNALNLDLWTYNKSLKSKIFNDVKAYRRRYASMRGYTVMRGYAAMRR